MLFVGMSDGWNDYESRFMLILDVLRGFVREVMLLRLDLSCEHTAWKSGPKYGKHNYRVIMKAAKGQLESLQAWR